MGYYSHIDWVTPWGTLRGARSDVIKGVPAGYEDRPLNYEDWTTQTQWTIEVTEDQYWAYIKFSDEQLHKPYDSRGLIRTYVFGRDWRDDDAWWCSEEIARNMEVAGIYDFGPHMKNVEPGHCAFVFIGARAKRVEFKDHLPIEG